MILLGIFLAYAKPFLMVIPAMLLYSLSGFFWPKVFRLYRGILSLGLVVCIVLGVWLIDHDEFSKQCLIAGEPHILKKQTSTGFYLDDSTANSFGMRYLQEEGFDWIEAKSIYHPDRFTRYEKTANGIKSFEIPTLTARYKVASIHASLSPSIRMQSLHITDMQTNELLAQAHHLYFDGGRFAFMVGGFGNDSCPNPSTKDGNAWFKRFYHLAKDTLRH